MTTWTSRVESSLWRFYDRGDSRVKSRVESPGESCSESSGDLPQRDCRPSTNPIPERAETGFPAVPATLHGHAINCVPVHRFRMGRTPETGTLPRLNGVNFRAMHLCAYSCMPWKTEPARFWRVFGWFVACFAGFRQKRPEGPQAVLITDVMVM